MDVSPDTLRAFADLGPLMVCLAIITSLLWFILRPKKAITDTEALAHTMILVSDEFGQKLGNFSERTAMANERTASALECMCEMQKEEQEDRRRAEHDRKLLEEFKTKQGIKQ